jgi:hypothetical protein
MYNQTNLQGSSPVLIKDQELANNLIKAEFAWNDAVTLDEKRKSLSLLNSALAEIEKFDNEKVEKKPSLYFDVDPSLIPTMMREMEARIIQNERLQNCQNPEWMDKKLDEMSNLKEMGYSASEAERYVGVINVQWDNQSWEEQRG